MAGGQQGPAADCIMIIDLQLWDPLSSTRPGELSNGLHAYVCGILFHIATNCSVISTSSCPAALGTPLISWRPLRPKGPGPRAAVQLLAGTAGLVGGKTGGSALLQQLALSNVPE